MTSRGYGPGGFIIVDQKRKKERLDFWNQLFQKYDVADEDDDAAFPCELIPVVAERNRGLARKVGATFKTRRGNGVGKKKRKINAQLLHCKRDTLKNVGDVKLGTTSRGILNSHNSLKTGGKENMKRNFNRESSKVKAAQKQDVGSKAILKTETNIDTNRKSKRIHKRRTFTLYHVAAVPRKRRTHTIQKQKIKPDPHNLNSQRLVVNIFSKEFNQKQKIKPDPHNLNSQRLVVNIFSKEFNRLLATKYKHCLAKVVSSKKDLAECCKKLRSDLNANAGSAKDISPNCSQSNKGTSRTNLTVTSRKSTRRPEINKTNCNVTTIDLGSEEQESPSLDMNIKSELLDEIKSENMSIKSELLDEKKSENIEVSQENNTSLSRSRRLWRSCKKENNVKSELQPIKSEFDSEYASLGDSSSRSLTTNLKLEDSHEDLRQKPKCEVEDVSLSRKCTRGKKLEALHEDLGRKLKSEVEDVGSSRKRTRGKTLATKLKLEASQENLGEKQKCDLEDVGPARKSTRGKRAKKTSVKPEPLVEDVPQNKRKSLRKRVCKNKCRWCVNCTSETTPKIKCEAGLQTTITRKSCANNKASEAQIKLEKRETHNSTVPAVNAKVKSENESRKTQSLNVFSSDTSTNARWCLRNRTVFESNEMNEQLEAKLLIEEKLKSDLGNMVFQRFCCLNLPDGDKSLLEFWNGEVKKELRRLSKVVSFKKLSLYMKLALADRLSQSLNGSATSEDSVNEQSV